MHAANRVSATSKCYKWYRQARQPCRAPVCPAFAFGQTDCFHYLNPGPPLFPKPFMRKVASKLGFAPLLFWGKWGTPLPEPRNVTLVIGDPIRVPKIDDPSKEDCQKYLDEFIASMKDLFYKHREDAGYSDQELLVL